MKNTLTPFKIFLLITIGLIFYSCDEVPKEQEQEQEEESMFDNSYGGSLIITYSCTYPEFTGTTNCKIEMDVDGIITGHLGVLRYAGETIIPKQSKFFRSGTLFFIPSGECYCGGFDGEFEDCTLTIYEGADGHETMKLWAWDDDNQEWVLSFEQNDIPINFDRGFGFSLNKALTNFNDVGMIGHIIEVDDTYGHWAYELMLSAVPN